MIRPPPSSTLFPYPTLFRSVRIARRHRGKPLVALRERIPTAARLESPGIDHRRSVAGEVLGDRREVRGVVAPAGVELPRSEEHTSELQSQANLVCRLLL